jgi:signal transduction histidine kinase
MSLELLAGPAVVATAELALLGVHFGLRQPSVSLFPAYEWGYSALMLVGFSTIMLAVSTSNVNKRRQATVVAADALANAFGLVLCGTGATYVPISPAGLRMPYGLFVMEAMQPITALLTAQESLRVMLAATNTSEDGFAVKMRLMQLVIGVRSAFVLASIANRWNPAQPAIWLLWVAVAVLYLISTVVMRLMHKRLVASTARTRQSWRSALPLGVALALAPLAVVLVLLADVAYVHWGLSAEIAEALMSAGLVLRSGQALMMLLVTWSVNDEGRISERDAALVHQKLALQEQRDAERLKQIRYVTHEVRGPLNCILLGLQSLREAAAATAAAQAQRQLLLLPDGAAAPALDAAADGSDGSGGGVYLDDEARESLAVMTSAAEGMLATVSDLLDLAKAEAGAFAINLQPMSLRTLVRSVAAQVAPYALADRVDVSWEVHPSVPPWTLGDPLRLSQSLLNFVRCVCVQAAGRR